MAFPLTSFDIVKHVQVGAVLAILLCLKDKLVDEGSHYSTREWTNPVNLQMGEKQENEKLKCREKRIFLH